MGSHQSRAARAFPLEKEQPASIADCWPAKTATSFFHPLSLRPSVSGSPRCRCRRRCCCSPGLPSSQLTRNPSPVASGLPIPLGPPNSTRISLFLALPLTHFIILFPSPSPSPTLGLPDWGSIFMVDAYEYI